MVEGISSPPRLRPAQPGLVPPAPACRNGWRPWPGCAASSGWPVAAGGVGRQGVVRSVAAGLVRYVQFRGIFHVAQSQRRSAGRWPLVLDVRPGPPRRRRWKGLTLATLKTSQAPPCRRCACARRGLGSSRPGLPPGPPLPRPRLRRPLPGRSSSGSPHP